MLLLTSATSVSAQTTEAERKEFEAVKAMAETGIDISEQKSKDVDVFGNMEFDYVITLCDDARESCPYFPAKTRLIHQGFEDPPKLAEEAKNEEEAMAPYRRIRDEIKAFGDPSLGASSEDLVHCHDG